MYEEDDLTHLDPLINRFEEMLSEDEVWFFDVQEFELISDFYFERGQITKALKAAQFGADQHPGNSSFVVRKTQCFTASNKFKKAHSELAQLESLNPESYDLYMAKAALFSKQNRHEAAIGFYKKALQKAEFPEDVYPLIALEYQITGDFENAYIFLHKTLSLNPDDEVALYNIALCFDILEKTEEGIKYLTEFTDQNPYNETAWHHLAILHARTEDYHEALRAVDFAILIDEYFTAAYFEKGRILEKTFQYQKAVETYCECLEFDAPSGFIYLKIGLCYLKMHKEQKAISYFTKAVTEDNELDEAYYELALLHDENESFQESVYHIDQALKIDPDNYDYLMAGARIYRRAGSLYEAETIYKRMTYDLLYLEPEMFIDHAELLFDLCEFDLGMNVLYQGIEECEESATLNYRLAGYLYTLRESDEADIYLKKALKLNSDNLYQFFELFPQLRLHDGIEALIKEFRANNF